MNPNIHETLPLAPPDSLDGFLADMSKRFNPEDEYRALTLLENVYDAITYAQDSSTNPQYIAMHKRNAPAFFTELITVIAQYYALNPATLHSSVLQILGMTIEMRPIRRESFESIDASSALPILNTITRFRERKNELDQQRTEQRTPINSLQSLLLSIRKRLGLS